MARIIAAMLVFAAAATGGGCVVGQQIPFQVQTPRLYARGGASVSLAVQDQRDEVRSGERTPDFCGFMRSGLGIPYQVTTASNAPLASDFADIVARGLRLNGFRVLLVVAPPNQPEAATLQALASGAADLSLLIRISEWRSDTLTRTKLTYRATAQLRDRQGQVIAESLISGKDALPGDFLDPMSKMKETVPDAARANLERLLNTPSMAQALASAGALPPVPPAAPSSGPDS
jgi:hypothetical protein